MSELTLTADQRKAAEWWCVMNRHHTPESTAFKAWLKDRGFRRVKRDRSDLDIGDPEKRHAWDVMVRLSKEAGGHSRCLVVWDEQLIQ